MTGEGRVNGGQGKRLKTNNGALLVIPPLGPERPPLEGRLEEEGKKRFRRAPSVRRMGRELKGRLVFWEACSGRPPRALKQQRFRPLWLGHGYSNEKDALTDS